MWAASRWPARADAGVIVLAIAVVALIAKAIVLPIALRRTVARAGSSIVVDASVHTPAALLVAFALIAVGFLAIGPVSAPAGLALGETLVGLWLVASRRALLSQVVGLMAAENGAALLMTVLAGEQGALVEGLLLLEAVAIPFALLALAALVRRAHGSADTSLLQRTLRQPRGGPMSAQRLAVIAVSAAGSLAALLLGVAAAADFGGIDPVGRVAALGVALAWFGASAAGPAYYARHLDEDASEQRRIVRLTVLTQVFSVALAVAAVSRNLAVTWVSLETTTIVGAFLVAAGDDRRDALEAAWKFAILCFAGVGFGLVGIGLLAASAKGIPGVVPTNLDSLALVAHRLDPRLLSLALAALLVGFGTKAGLFPLHWWLPDAHSQGPTPVSALMSGGLVATSLAVIVKVLATLQGVALVGAFQHVLIGSGVARASSSRRFR